MLRPGVVPQLHLGPPSCGVPGAVDLDEDAAVAGDAGHGSGAAAGTGRRRCRCCRRPAAAAASGRRRAAGRTRPAQRGGAAAAGQPHGGGADVDAQRRPTARGQARRRAGPVRSRRPGSARRSGRAGRASPGTQLAAPVGGVERGGRRAGRRAGQRAGRPAAARRSAASYTASAVADVSRRRRRCRSCRSRQRGSATARAKRLSGGHAPRPRGRRRRCRRRAAPAAARPAGRAAQRGQGVPAGVAAWTSDTPAAPRAWPGFAQAERPPAAVSGRPEHRVARSASAAPSTSASSVGGQLRRVHADQQRWHAGHGGVGERVGEPLVRARRRAAAPAASRRAAGWRPSSTRVRAASRRRADGGERVGQRRRGDPRRLRRGTRWTEPGLDPARAPAPWPAPAPGRLIGPAPRSCRGRPGAVPRTVPVTLDRVPAARGCVVDVDLGDPPAGPGRRDDHLQRVAEPAVAQVRGRSRSSRRAARIGAEVVHRQPGAAAQPPGDQAALPSRACSGQAPRLGRAAPARAPDRPAPARTGSATRGSCGRVERAVGVQDAHHAVGGRRRRSRRARRRRTRAAARRRPRRRARGRSPRSRRSSRCRPRSPGSRPAAGPAARAGPGPRSGRAVPHRS